MCWITRTVRRTVGVILLNRKQTHIRKELLRLFFTNLTLLTIRFYSSILGRNTAAGTAEAPPPKRGLFPLIYRLDSLRWSNSHNCADSIGVAVTADALSKKGDLSGYLLLLLSSLYALGYYYCIYWPFCIVRFFMVVKRPQLY